MKSDVINLYLDLLKQTLTSNIWTEELQPLYTNKMPFPDRYLYYWLGKYLSRRRIELVRRRQSNPELREEGKDHPSIAYTMIGMKRLSNIQSCVEEIIANNIPGDLIEAGVWRGGAVIFMRAILKVYGISNRIVFAADSFEGLPKPDVTKYPEDAGDEHYLVSHLAVSLDQVKENFKKFGLLDDQVTFIKGWFRDTLPNLDCGKFAVIRLDGDMYESTMDSLSALYPKLSLGGYIIIDDYGYVESCRKAVTDYRSRHNITEKIQTIDWSGVYWQKNTEISN